MVAGFLRYGLVAQTIRLNNHLIDVEWIARTPPKRQVEGSNPSEPALVLVLKWDSRKMKKIECLN